MGLKLPEGTVLPAGVPKEEMTAKQLEELRLNAQSIAAQAAIDKKTKPKGNVVVSKTDLASIVTSMRKAKGDGIAVQGSTIPPVERVPTGVFEFDAATGGGFPRGRYTIVYGPESSGKTNLVYKAIANVQKMPPPCNKAVLIDLEGTFDPVWAAQFGVDVDALVVIKPGYGEEAGDLLDAIIRADDVMFIGFDSLAVMVSAKEAEQSLENFDVGTSSLLVKRMVNKTILALNEEAKRGHTPALVFINQTRMKIGVMFGNPETMPGGKAMLFLASLIVRVSAKNKIEKSVNPDIHSFKETSAIIKKSKVPATKTEFQYDMCVYAHDGLGVGDTNSWNMVSSALKQMGALVKDAAGWKLDGKIWKTLDLIRDTYQGEPDFMLKLQKVVTDSLKGTAKLVAADFEKLPVVVDDTPEGNQPEPVPDPPSQG